MEVRYPLAVPNVEVDIVAPLAVTVLELRERLVMCVPLER